MKTLVLMDSRLGARKLVGLLVKYEVPTIYLCNTEHLGKEEQKRVRAENRGPFGDLKQRNPV